MESSAPPPLWINPHFLQECLDPTFYDFSKIPINKGRLTLSGIKGKITITKQKGWNQYLDFSDF